MVDQLDAVLMLVVSTTSRPVQRLQGRMYYNTSHLRVSRWSHTFSADSVPKVIKECRPGRSPQMAGLKVSQQFDAMRHDSSS
jgi:hypothetical protein